jgi:hypothetical protein
MLGAKAIDCVLIPGSWNTGNATYPVDGRLWPFFTLLVFVLINHLVCISLPGCCRVSLSLALRGSRLVSSLFSPSLVPIVPPE